MQNNNDGSEIVNLGYLLQAIFRQNIPFLGGSFLWR